MRYESANAEELKKTARVFGIFGILYPTKAEPALAGGTQEEKPFRLRLCFFRL